jgi:hypothetical protein
MLRMGGAPGASEGVARCCVPPPTPPVLVQNMLSKGLRSGLVLCLKVKNPMITTVKLS